MINVFALQLEYNPNIWTAGGLSFVLGFCIGPIFIASNTVAHMVSDERMRGKVFTALEIVIHFAFLMAMLLSSLISEKVGLPWILRGVGLLTVFVGLLGFIQFKSRIGLAVK